jgi:hypothetical protein
VAHLPVSACFYIKVTVKFLTFITRLYIRIYEFWRVLSGCSSKREGRERNLRFKLQFSGSKNITTLALERQNDASLRLQDFMSVE